MKLSGLRNVKAIVIEGLLYRIQSKVDAIAFPSNEEPVTKEVVAELNRIHEALLDLDETLDEIDERR